MRKFLIALTATFVGIATYWFGRRNDWRCAYSIEVIRHFQDNLAAAEREFFLIYNRDETRRNIHNALAYVCGEYMGDIALFRRDLGWVSTYVLDNAIVNDPAGRAAYLELQKYLNQSKTLLDDITPEPDLIDKLNGGIWEENKRRIFIKIPDPPEDELLYDPVITPKVVFRRNFPEIDFSDEELKEFRRIHQIRKAELGNN